MGEESLCRRLKGEACVRRLVCQKEKNEQPRERLWDEFFCFGFGRGREAAVNLRGRKKNSVGGGGWFPEKKTREKNSKLVGGGAADWVF